MRRILALVFVTGIALFGAAGPTAAATPGVATPAAHPLTAEDANAWLDGYIPAALARGEIAGAVVVIVKDGQVLTERGFGVADVATGAPVDPKTTAFRPGSVSKLFTWTAVMQLVEQGRLNLDADVNTYLDFRIPPRNGKPITLRNLMTHTPGFEEVNKHLADPNPRDRSLGDALKRWVPTRVFDPGTTPAYSNYGAALAGYIVERVSGEPFDVYIANHIFKPLDMGHSSFSLPMQPSILANMSKGYLEASGPPQPFEDILFTPAGQMAGAGDDMAHFMIAHLQDGRYGDAQILKPETAHLMHDSSTALMAPLHGMELGFIDYDINGHRVIGHNGDTKYFHSILTLFIDDNVGLYVSINSSGAGPKFSRAGFSEAFADRYFPGVNTDGKVDALTAAEHARMVSGNYVGQRASFDSLFALPNLISQMTVGANPDGTVRFPMAHRLSGEPYRFREIAPFVWRAIGGRERCGAIAKGGKVVRVSCDSGSAVIVFDRVSPCRDASWILPAAQAGALVVILTALGWPLIAFVRRRYGKGFALQGRRANAYRVVRIGAVAAVGAMVAGVLLFSGVSEPEGLEALGNNDGELLFVEALTVLGFVGGFLTSLYNLFVVFAEKARWFARVWAILLSASFLALSWFAYVGGFMTFTTNY